jgi:hypothetical protein
MALPVNLSARYSLARAGRRDLIEGESLQDLTGERQRESVGTAPRLCIVSQERALRWTELTVALRQTLNPQDELRIIIDRRSTRPLTEAPPGPGEQPRIERRRHPHVDVALNLDGFAIVPASASAHVETAPLPVDTASRDAGEVQGAERRADDADPPRTEPPGSATRTRGARSASPEWPPRTPPRGETLDELDVDDAEPQSHETELPQHSDRFPRPPTRRTVNPSI